MRRITKHLVIMAALTVAQPAITGKYDYSVKYFHAPVVTNICENDNRDRQASVMCHCDTTRPKMATRADCFIFTEVTPEDPIWPNFSFQPGLLHLVFNDRTDHKALTFIPAKAIVRLVRLKELSIQFSVIHNIPPYAFTNSSSIRQISLKSNKIFNLERHSFAQMMMLSDLNLDDNYITEIRRDVFFGLPNLHILHLSNNNLSLIHEGCFKHLNNLIELNLDVNYISVVTKEMFEGLEKLSSLNLRNNLLTMIGNLAFSEMWGLKDLMLDNNAIKYVADRAFGGLSQLRKLTLSGNKLTVFFSNILKERSTLIVLDLKDNLLETMSYEAIRPVIDNGKSSPKAVYLDGNPFRCDCRLAWIYRIRNKTQDNTLKRALENISCLMHAEKKQEHINRQKDNAVENYDEDYYDMKEDNVNKVIRLIDIPFKNLSCTKEMRDLEVDEDLTQNGIKVKALSNRCVAPSLILLLISNLI